jgi:hypothetical protein
MVEKTTEEKAITLANDILILKGRIDEYSFDLKEFKIQQQKKCAELQELLGKKKRVEVDMGELAVKVTETFETIFTEDVVNEAIPLETRLNEAKKAVKDYYQEQKDRGNFTMEPYLSKRFRVYIVDKLKKKGKKK